MADFDYDLLVIGAGSGGVRAARMAAGKGARVAVVEAKDLGGTCVNVGCVPKKLMVYASQFADQSHDATGFGWQVGAKSHDWPTLIDNKNKEIRRLNGIYQKLLENAGVTIIRGFARLVDGHTVSVGDDAYRAEKILVTVGCKPSLPDVPGIEHAITSDDVFFLQQRPQTVAIVGGGYIAVEFAGIFNGLGSDVKLLYRGDHLLRHFDNGVAAFVSEEIVKKGVDIHYQTNIQAIVPQGEQYCCELDNGNSLVVDQVMYATGRSALTQSLGLENTAVRQREDDSIMVDDRFCTDEPSIFALGDVIGTPELTPVALAQAMVFVDQQFGSDNKTMDYQSIPTAIFCQPELATVGLSEQAVKKQGIHCDVYLTEFRPLKHTLSGSGERAMIKMLVDVDSDKVLGVHIAGEHAGEMLQGFAVAVKAGLSKAQFDATIGIHPTMAEELVTLREAKYRI